MPTHRRTALFATLVLGLLAVFGGTPLTSLEPAGAQAGPGLGVYRGSGAPGEVAAFGSWLGRAPTYALDFLPGDTWITIEDPGWTARRWSGSGLELVLSVPMLPPAGATMAEGAAGAHNVHFRRLAEALAAEGAGDAIIRLGWELNGSWYPWAAQYDTGAFVDYWREVVDTMRGVEGTDFRFAWDLVLGTTQFPVEAAYPGGDYVDFISASLYDQSWYSEDHTDAVRRWQRMLTQTHGLDWLESFAGSEGKPLAFSEWGLSDRSDGNGGGDNPYFIERMHEWITTRNLAFQNYFEHDLWAGERHRMMTGLFPDAAQRYIELFGGAETTTSSTLVPTSSTTSPPTTVVSPDIAGPEAPDDVSAVANGRRINLSWSEPTSGSSVARYKIFRGRSSGGPFDHYVGSTTGLTIRDRNLAPNTTYHYLVKSVDGAGNWSSGSGTASATTT
jgi:hypothetical protein